MNNFIAVDVETANGHPSSICAIGLVKVKDGLIVDKRYSLVKPEPEFFSPICVRVHGIRPEDVDSAPSFGPLWASLSSWFEGLPFIAHNAAFDMKCIIEACKIYRLDPPDPESFYCTLISARKQIPRGVLPSKSLDSLCEYFGVPLLNHHNALDDAVACAKIAVILL